MRISRRNIIKNIMDNSKLSQIVELVLDNSAYSAFSSLVALSSAALSAICDSSSSSSSSSEDLDCEVHPKVDNFVELIDSYSDADFKSHMRLQRPTVEYLISTFQQSKFLPVEKRGRRKIGERKSVYMYIWYIANTVTFRQLGNLFGVAKSSAWVAVRRVSSWLVSLSGEVIKWPQGAAAQEIKKKFEAKQKIPNVIGAIDCTHIGIKAPRDNKQDYFDRKQNYSLVVQAVVDSSKRFIDVTCGEPGSLHDSRVLRRSSIYHRVETHYDELFSGGSYLLGDSAYPSKSWLVTPFKDKGNLTDGQRRFNYIHSSTRMVVENAFGLLKGRFRRLSKFTEQTDLLLVSQIILSACVLHNICITMDDLCDEAAPLEPDENATEEIVMEESVPLEGDNQRVALYHYLFSNNIV